MYRLLPWSREQEWGWNKHEELDQHNDSILKLICGEGCTKLNFKKKSLIRISEMHEFYEV